MKDKVRSARLTSLNSDSVDVTLDDLLHTNGAFVAKIIWAGVVDEINKNESTPKQK